MSENTPPLPVEKDKQLSYLMKIIEAYDKVSRMCQDELSEAKETISAYEKVAKLSREELIKARQEIDELKNRENILKQEILSILTDNTITEEVLIQRLETLGQRSDNGFYSDLFRVIASLDLKEEDAEIYWKEILDHSEKLSVSLNRKVGFRVAMLDYLTNKKNLVKNPKIIEFDIFEEVIRHSVIDELTGIYNRRYFNNSLMRELKRGSRYGKSLSLFLFDIDNFKSFNDQYGHSMGDKALQIVARCLTQCFRTEDTVARTGGEEFAVILPEVEPENAIKPCIRFMSELRRYSGLHLPREITLSGGISGFPENGISPEDLYIHADELGYKAKRTGKDKICI
jgi:two-component system, cell cycle response regulator